MFLRFAILAMVSHFPNDKIVAEVIKIVAEWVAPS